MSQIIEAGECICTKEPTWLVNFKKDSHYTCELCKDKYGEFYRVFSRVGIKEQPNFIKINAFNDHFKWLDDI